MSLSKRYLVTAALPYANGPLHIGHLAGAYLPADIYTRYLRLCKADVAFVCGSDEHGAAITIKATKEGTTPQKVVDKYHKQLKITFEKFGIAFDTYHRTSEELHHITAQEFFTDLEKKGHFKVQESEQYYDAQAQQFLADRYISGTCPKCGNPDAYGDQCERCGSSLSPTDLIEPKSTITGSAPELRKTRHWYLPMQQHEGWLKQWIEEGILDGKKHHQPEAWRKHVVGQCMSWVNGGLQARAITRDLEWGVKVPLKNADGKVLYVWLDAPIGYISATKAWAEKAGKNWKDYWQNEETQLVHFIGKDNIVFHCIIFPIILKLKGGYNLPINVPANEFLNLEGNKISTSRNWAVWLHEYLKDFPDKQDVLRYVLTSIAPENKDSEFTWKDFQERNNSELVSILGNFVNRAVVLTNKFFRGDVPMLGELAQYDKNVLAEAHEISVNVAKLIEQFRFREAQFEAMKLARIGNKYLADTKPWEVAKQDKQIAGTVLNIALELVARLAITMQPFLPDASAKLAHLLGLRNTEWSQLEKENLLTPYDKLAPAQHLFKPIEDAEIDKQVRKLELSKLANEPAAPVKPNISFEQFAGLDLRVGKVIAAEKIPKTKKLLKLLVDVGLEKRTIVSGIGEYYEPKQVKGKQVTVIVNLAPRTIKGVESNGMLLMAEDKDGKLHLLLPDGPVTAGSIIS